MRKLVLLVVALALSALAVVPAFAQTGTIVDVAAGAPRFSTLVAAVTAAGLADELSARGPFTVFAPTDGAFRTLLNDLGVTADQLLADRRLLTDVLLYHVVPGRVVASDITSAQLPLTVETLGGASVTLNVVNNRVVINNGRASVEVADILGSNGVIHQIDNVLLPPAVAAAPAATAPTSASTNSIVDVLAANPNYSTLVAAVTAAGLADDLSASGSFTVFAPTNGAFNTLLRELNVTADQLLANRALLTDVLLYHVLPGEFRAADILAARLPLTVEALNGDDVTITFNGQRVILNNGRASVEVPNIIAGNGVIHQIDNVILPPQ